MTQEDIPIPASLDWHQFVNSVVIPCCKRPWYKSYKRTLKKVTKDVDRQLDLVSVVRRLRMHGLALTALLNAAQRTFSSHIAQKKAVDFATGRETASLWYKDEQLTK